jgi:NitT/TauT family transport system permease protein
MIYSLIAMGVIIVLVDRLLWKPLIVWSDKFKVEDTGSGENIDSVVLDYLRRITLLKKTKKILQVYTRGSRRNLINKNIKDRISNTSSLLLKAIAITIMIAFIIFVFFGVYKAGSILHGLTHKDLIYIITSVSLTFLRVLATLVISIAWAVPFGVYIGLRKQLATRFQSIVQFFASYPAPMLYPFALLILQKLHIGLGIGSVVLMLLGAQWYVLYNTISGAMSIPEDLIDVRQLFKIKGIVLWKDIIIPAIAPQLVTGIITASGGAWNASIVAEYVLYKNKIIYTKGIGTLINLAIENNNMRMLLGGTFAMILVVVVINVTVWKRLYKTVSQLHQLES